LDSVAADCQRSLVKSRFLYGTVIVPLDVDVLHDMPCPAGSLVRICPWNVEVQEPVALARCPVPPVNIDCDCPSKLHGSGVSKLMHSDAEVSLAIAKSPVEVLLPSSAQEMPLGLSSSPKGILPRESDLLTSSGFSLSKTQRLCPSEDSRAAGLPKSCCAPLTLDTAVPVVTLVFPVSTGARWQEVYFGQVLHHLVAELDRRIEAQRRAVIGI